MIIAIIRHQIFQILKDISALHMRIKDTLVIDVLIRQQTSLVSNTINKQSTKV